MTKGTDEMARLFGATLGRTGNFATAIYPGYPGLVVANGELRSMVWGFPLILKSKKTGQSRPRDRAEGRHGDALLKSITRSRRGS
jgi:hypothetical protein